MRRFICLLAAILPPLSFAVDYEFLAGSTDKFITVNMYALDNTPKTGLLYTDMTITYTRNNGSADVDVTEATMTMGTHADGGFIQVDATNTPGLYQFALPDAAIASGAESVMISFKAADTFQRFVQCSIINVDLRGSSYVPANTVQIEGSDATNQINAEADTALADYDAPTNAEMVARTVTSATYATASALSTAQGDITSILADTSAVDTTAEMRTFLTGSDTPVATAAAQSTAQSDLDILTGSNGVTLATSQPNYAPATASALSAIDTKIDTIDNVVDTILVDTAAVDTTTEMRTFLTGADTPVAKESSIATAQADLDIITGSNGVTLASSQPNYAPYTGTPPTVGQIRTELEGTGTKLSLVLADTDELQTRFGLMIEADGGDWRFDANALEEAPAGGGGGGDATAANQTTIITHLTDIKGATWSSSSDTLEAIRDAIEAIDAGGGSGNTLIDHDFGGTDELRVVDGNGNGIQSVTILAYVASEFAANPLTATVRATARTGPDGRWESPYMMLDEDTEYTLYFFKAGVYGPATTNITP